MEQQPRGVTSDVLHDVDFEVSKVVALEGGETATGAQVVEGQASVVLVVHPAFSDEERYTFQFAWKPDAARFLGDLLIKQADIIEREASS